MNFWGRRGAIGVCAVLLLSGSSRAGDEEPYLLFEMGGGGEFGLRGGQSFGPEIGLEYMAIKRLLEIEMSVSPLFSHGQAEIETEVTFKKPFEITDRFEIEIGGGPEWIHRTNGKPDSVAGVAMADFVYEILPQHHVSLFIDPAYSYDFGEDHEKVISVMAGLRIGIE
jgi:hypothetical protein